MKETVDEKIERLFYYINLMRDCVQAPETFLFWDWAISKQLNRFEVREIIDITKDFSSKYRENENIKFNDYAEEIEKVLKWEGREEYKEPITKNFIITMLNSLKRLMFKDFIDYLIKQSN